jgi:hypothetical protein
MKKLLPSEKETFIKDDHKLNSIGIHNTGIYTPNQCWESGMIIPDPDFYPPRISDPTKSNITGGEKPFLEPQIAQHGKYFIFEH